MPHFSWKLSLRSSPQALWAWVSNTDRFARDCGLPPVQAVPLLPGDPEGASRMQMKVMGLRIECLQHPFEWLAPQSFMMRRDFHRGPLRSIVVRLNLLPDPTGGTILVHECDMNARSFLWWLPVWMWGRGVVKQVKQVLNAYDLCIKGGALELSDKHRTQLSRRERAKLSAVLRQLEPSTREHLPPGELGEVVAKADDLTVERLRPYVFASAWNMSRRKVLELFLRATHAGLLEFQWELLCPQCRCATHVVGHLQDMQTRSVCPECTVEYTARLDQNVELTFRPGKGVRRFSARRYVPAGPRRTPHIIAQRMLEAGDTWVIPVPYEPGEYRLRAFRRAWACTIGVQQGAERELELAFPFEDGAAADFSVAPAGRLAIGNGGDTPALAIFETVAWPRDSATAADVIELEMFREIFSNEVVRANEPVFIGSLTVVFTDLRSSTRMYREIGDAQAFNRVLSHFRTLRRHIGANDGTIVKTMGDAVMAVFARPRAAFRAVLGAQAELAADVNPLALKAGIHHGSALAINQNGRLDYFGTTVNIAARICPLSDGGDVVFTDEVAEDPEVAPWLAKIFSWSPERAQETRLKGLEDLSIRVHRLRSMAAGSTAAWPIRGGSLPSIVPTAEPGR